MDTFKFSRGDRVRFCKAGYKCQEFIVIDLGSMKCCDGKLHNVYTDHNRPWVMEDFLTKCE